MRNDATDYARNCDLFQRMRNPSRRDEIPLVPQVTLHPFDKWIANFLGPINPLGKRTGSRYIITVIDYLMRWEKAAPVTNCTAATAARFLFDNVITRFGCLKILVNDQGNHFIN